MANCGTKSLASSPERRKQHCLLTYSVPISRTHTAANTPPSVIQSHHDDPGARGATMSIFGAFLDSQKITPGEAMKNRRSAHSNGSAVLAKPILARYVNH